MRKLKKDAIAPVKQASEKTEKQIQKSLVAKRFDAYNKASKAKVESLEAPKPEKVFEYYYDEYDEYLSS